MARSARTSNPVTLFPFLAVLLCTIGALVLMLVVVSAGIRKDAVETAKNKSKADAVASRSAPAYVENAEDTAPSIASAAQHQPIDPEFTPDPPPSPIKEASPRTLSEITRLSALAQDLQAEIANRSHQVANVSAKTLALRRQLRTVKAQENDLQQAIIRTANQRAELEESTSELRVENQQIIEWLDESRKLINEHKQQLLSPVHSIVPYDGQTGTVRRAIIIECVNDVVRFESEQVEIPIEVLRRFSPEQNPLSSGVQALFGYWMAKEQQADPGRQPRKPYALILVRPSGAEAFSSAVFALDELIGDFGYELVESEFKYEVPETTPDAIRECRAAVEAELRRGPIRSRRALSPQGPVDISRVARGPAASRNFFSSDDFRNRRAGSSDSEAQTGAGTDNSRTGRGTAGSLTAGSGIGTTAGRRSVSEASMPEPQSDGRTDSFLQGLAARGNSLLEKGPPSGFDSARAAAMAEALRSRSAGADSFADRPAGIGEGASDTDGATKSTERGGTSNQTSNRLSGGGINRDLTVAPRDGGGREAEDNSTFPPRWLANTNGRPASDGSGQRPGNTGTSGEGQSDRGQSDQGQSDQGQSDATPSNSNSPGGGGTDGEQQHASSSGTSSSRSTSPDGKSETQPANVSDSSARQADSTDLGASRNTTPSASGSASASGSSSSRESPSRESSSGSDNSPVNGNGPTMPMLSRSSQVRSLKPQRRWGMSHPDASLGLEKVVVVTVEPGRVVIANQYQVTRRPELTTEEITNRTILALDEVAKKWGWPPPRFYWVPSVRVNFEPSEQQLGTLVQKALQEAGAGLEK